MGINSNLEIYWVSKYDILFLIRIIFNSTHRSDIVGDLAGLVETAFIIDV